MITAIVFIGIFIIADALSDAYIFRDFRNRQGGISNVYFRRSLTSKVEKLEFDSLVEVIESNKIWHTVQAVRQGAAIIFAAWTAGYWVLAVIAAAAFWIIHDVLVNTIGLRRGPFYVGNTAWIDRQFQRFDNPERAMALTKFVILTVSVGLTLIFKP